MLTTESPSAIGPQLHQLLASVVVLRSDVLTNGEALLTDLHAWQDLFNALPNHGAGIVPAVSSESTPV